MRKIVVLGMLASTIGCGSGNTATPNDASAETIATCSCAAGEACLVVTVTRTADVSRQPWTVWPTEADGTGTLVVSARDTAPRARVTVANANVAPASASYRVDLGCVPAGTLTLGAFLDDNTNAANNDTSSADYRDSCMMDRRPTRVIQAGAVNDVALALNNSCD